MFFQWTGFHRGRYLFGCVCWNGLSGSSKLSTLFFWGARDGAVVRVLTSHQCGPGSNPNVDAIMWVEFVVGSPLCSERFFTGYSGFPLSSKTNISKFQFDQESGRRRTTLWMCYLQIIIIIITPQNIFTFQ